MRQEVFDKWSFRKVLAFQMFSDLETKQFSSSFTLQFLKTFFKIETCRFSNVCFYLTIESKNSHTFSILSFLLVLDISNKKCSVFPVHWNFFHLQVPQISVSLNTYFSLNFFSDLCLLIFSIKMSIDSLLFEKDCFYFKKLSLLLESETWSALMCKSFIIKNYIENPIRTPRNLQLWVLP